MARILVVDDEEGVRSFLAESLERAHFRGDLEETLHQNGIHDIDETGTATAAVYRVWGDLKAKLGGGDHALLATAEKAEDEVKDAYADALKRELPLPVREMLGSQQAHVLTSHDFVRSHRRDLRPRTLRLYRGDGRGGADGEESVKCNAPCMSSLRTQGPQRERKALIATPRTFDSNTALQRRF